MVVIQSPVRVTLSPTALEMHSTLTTPPLLEAWYPIKGDEGAVGIFLVQYGANAQCALPVTGSSLMPYLKFKYRVDGTARITSTSLQREEAS